jgi:hypothetical protein
MEFDTFERDDDDLYLQPQPKIPLFNPSSYVYKTSRNQTVTLIPLNHIIGGDVVAFKLWSLQQSLQSLTYKKISQDRLLRLDPPIRRLMIHFINNEPLDPVKVITALELNQPSPINRDHPSNMGLDTMYIKQELQTNDYLYRPLNNEDLVALSIFFGYTYLPTVQ